GRAPRRARPRAAALRRRALPGWPGGPRRRFAHRRSRRRGQVAAGDMLARVKGPLRFAVSAVLLVAAGAGAYLLGAWLRPEPPPAGTALQNPVPISGLALVDQRGEGFRLAEDMRGDVALVCFGYTRCPDACPLTMSQLSSAYTAAGEPEDLRVVMVSVDPEHDTPEVIGGYVERFHPSFVGLTGTNPQVAAAAKA